MNHHRIFTAPVIIPAIPVAIMTYFYLWYTTAGWFFQDDLGLMSAYSRNLRWIELYNFENFGRFVSRNIYWHIAWGLFKRHSQYYYLINFMTIVACSLMIYNIMKDFVGRYSAIVCAAIYYCLPATLCSYVWIANSQHILGHFFVLAFIHIYLTNKDKFNILHASSCTLLTAAGLYSNIFFGLVLSLPAVMQACNKPTKQSRAHKAFLAVSTSLFALFIFKLRKYNSGFYLTSYTTETIHTNLIYYFGSENLYLLWFCTILGGAFYGIKANNFIMAWFFVAGFLFITPYLIQTQQRYPNYGAMSYLFFTLGFVYMLHKSTYPILANIIATSILLCITLYALPYIRLYTDNPVGSRQKMIVDTLKVLTSQEPTGISSVCFSSSAESYPTGINADWLRLGDGFAFHEFVDQKKKYELQNTASKCDITYNFSEKGLSRTPHITNSN